MRVALGFKAHSGWAALVTVGARDDGVEVLDRRRMELIENRWAGAPYHAAEGMPRAQAERIVGEALEEVDRVTTAGMRTLIESERRAGRDLVACAIIASSLMPEWSVDQILAVHVRMHKAEGTLFPEALAAAARACGVRAVSIPQRALWMRAEQVLQQPLAMIQAGVARLGKTIGPPWGVDQKSAALAAMIALAEAA